MAGAMVMLMPTMQDAMMFMPGGTSRTDTDGNFTLTSVAPGEYSCRSSRMGAMMTDVGRRGDGRCDVGRRARRRRHQRAADQEREFATAASTSRGDDITGLVVGRHARRQGDRPAGLRRRREARNGSPALRIGAAPVDTDGAPMLGFGMAAVKENGTFEIDGLVGARASSASTTPPKGWFLKGVTHRTATTSPTRASSSSRVKTSRGSRSC